MNTPMNAAVLDRDCAAEGWCGDATSVVEFPLARVADYGMTIRMDPAPRPFDGAVPLPTVRVFLNRTFLCDFPLRWTGGRVGSYDLVVPRGAVRAGRNRLVLTLAPGPAADAPGGRPLVAGLSDGAAFALWYVRVRPQAAMVP